MFQFAIQAGVVDGHGRISREHLDNPFVVGGKFSCIDFFGQVNLPELVFTQANRHPEEGVHIGMIARKTHAARVSL